MFLNRLLQRFKKEEGPTAEQSNYERARELRQKVEEFINREFNFIDLEVYQTCNESFFEYIRQQPIADYVEDYIDSLSEDEKRDLEEEIKEELDIPVNNEVLEEYVLEWKEDEVREWVQDNRYDSDNYPCWSILFEFRSEPPESWVEAAEEVGLGVVDPQFAFNTTLFSKSAGHSFYSSYWIPLYLKIFTYEKEKWANIDFSMV